MPLYNFRCSNCLDDDDNQFEFELMLPVAAEKTNIECPLCQKNEFTNRFFGTFSVQWGLCASEKKAGTTKQRLDMGRYMKDAREKRKRTYGSETREGQSNELWVGNEVKDGVIKGPEQAKAGAKS